MPAVFLRKLQEIAGQRKLRVMQVDELERTGPEFNLNTYLAARATCIEAVDEIARKIESGMNEKEAQILCKQIFKEKGVSKFWHPTKIRIADDTVKNFSETGDPSIKLGPNEIFYIDVGPIIEKHEADFGRTYVLGVQSEYQKLAASSEKVFHQTAEYWRRTKATGRELYEFAVQEASNLGYELNVKMAGHRLGDFPHKVFSSTKLYQLKKSPIENLWVLEIHLIDPKAKRGAFFEDILF